MSSAIDPVLLAGLRELSESAFPKRCPTCGRVYETAAEYMRETQPVRTDRSGLKQSHDDAGTAIVELFRNCACGSTLMDVFCDRRNPTPAGQLRRQRFGELLDYLVARGIAREVGREELLKIMRGGTSEVLRGLRPAK